MRGNDYTISNSSLRTGILIVVCLGAFMANMDGTVVNVCLPTIATELNISPSYASLLILSYLLFEAGPLLAFGKLGDIRGSRLVFLMGFGLFTLSSLFCALAPTFNMLLIMRIMQGFGGAMIFSVMLTFAAVYFPLNKRGQAMGFTTMAAALGVAIGPMIGGVIANYFGWRAIFYINIPVGVLAILVGWFILPKQFPAAQNKKFDILGAIIQTLVLVLLIFGLNQGAELGWYSWPVLASLVGSAILLAIFIWYELRIPYPLIDIRMFSGKTTGNSLLNYCLAMMVFGGVMFIMPFYLQDIRGLDLTTVGLVMSIIALGQFLGPLSGKMSDRLGPKLLTMLGVLIGLVAFILFSTMDFGEPLWWVILAMSVFGLSQGVIRAPNIQLLMGSIPSGSKGAAAGMNSLMRSLGLVLGVVIFETLFSHFVPHEISTEVISLKSSGTAPHILHQGFEVSLVAGLILSLAMVVTVGMIRHAPGKNLA